MGGLRELMERVAQGELTVDEGLRGMAERLRRHDTGHDEVDPFGTTTDTDSQH